jgi:hypothetical protein
MGTTDFTDLEEAAKTDILPRAIICEKWLERPASATALRNKEKGFSTPFTCKDIPSNSAKKGLQTPSP